MKKNKGDNADMESKYVGQISFEMNLQNENKEEEAKRNFELKMQQVSEQHAR